MDARRAKLGHLFSFNFIDLQYWIDRNLTSFIVRNSLHPTDWFCASFCLLGSKQYGKRRAINFPCDEVIHLARPPDQRRSRHLNLFRSSCRDVYVWLFITVHTSEHAHHPKNSIKMRFRCEIGRKARRGSEKVGKIESKTSTIFSDTHGENIIQRERNTCTDFPSYSQHRYLFTARKEENKSMKRGTYVFQ